LFESLKILSYTERKVEELVNVPLARSLYSLTNYRRTYAVLCIHEQQTVWAETAERKVYAVLFGNKRRSETYT